MLAYNYFFFLFSFLTYCKGCHGPIEFRAGSWASTTDAHLKFWAQLFRALGLEAYDIIEHCISNLPYCHFTWPFFLRQIWPLHNLALKGLGGLTMHDTAKHTNYTGFVMFINHIFMG